MNIEMTQSVVLLDNLYGAFTAFDTLLVLFYWLPDALVFDAFDKRVFRFAEYFTFSPGHYNALKWKISFSRKSHYWYASLRER